MSTRSCEQPVLRWGEWPCDVIACCSDSKIFRTFVGVASRPQRAKALEVSMIANTVSLSWRIGRAIALARKQSNIDQIGPVIVDAVGGTKTAKVLFSGKIVDLRRRCVAFDNCYQAHGVAGCIKDIQLERWLLRLCPRTKKWRMIQGESRKSSTEL